MASATRTVTAPIRPTVTVTLTLSEDEARVIAHAWAHIGGKAKGTAREHWDAIAQALRSACVDVPFSNNTYRGGLYVNTDPR